MGCIDKKQGVSEQSTLTNFNKWSTTALKAFNIYTIIMTNNIGKIRIS